MNNTFKQKLQLDLDENWHLTPDGDNGIVLTFHEIRQRKSKKTKEEEDFLFEDKYYYPRVAQCLRKYSQIVQNTTESIEKILENSEKTLEVISRIDREFKQFD